MEDPNVPLPVMDEDEIRRLQRIQRRAWGATFAGMGILVLIFFVLGLVFLFWLLRLIDGSPTIS